MKDKLILKVASFAVEAARGNLKDLYGLRVEAAKILKDANNLGPLSRNLDNVQALVTEANANNKIVDGMLVGARKFFKA